MKKPNLLYVFPDQFRQMSLGLWNNPLFNNYCSGQPDPVYTPNLDQLAQQAYILPNAVSNCPVCSPHRGSLFTGQYPNNSGVPLNCNSERVISNLEQETKCLTDVLAQSGYHVGYIGKWHLDLPTRNAPDKPGQFVDTRLPAWDSYTEPQRRHGIHYWYGYGTFDEHCNPHYYDTNGVRHEPKVWSAEHEADKAIEYLKNTNGERDESSPFALFLSMNPPHSPYESLEDCREEDLALYADKPNEFLLVRDNVDMQLDKADSVRYYFANVSGVDKEFGRVVQTLKDIGEWENTVVVFTSDHGETLCSQGLTDAKNVIYEEAFLVPYLIKLPGQQIPHVVTKSLNSPDIFPTILDVLGLSAHCPSGLDGESRAQALTENSPNSAESIGSLYIRNLDGDKDQDGNVINYFAQSRGIRTERYTLCLEVNREYKLTEILLFDNQADPYQLNNIAFSSQPKLAKQLLSRLTRELIRIQDPWAKQKVLPDLLPYPNTEEL